jgi:ubiquinone biosynthesis protein
MTSEPYRRTRNICDECGNLDFIRPRSNLNISVQQGTPPLTRPSPPTAAWGHPLPAEVGLSDFGRPNVPNPGNLSSARERGYTERVVAAVILAVAHLLRLGHAGFVLAREGVFAGIDTTLLPPPARAAVRFARLIERPASRVAANRLAAALTRLGPSYVKLGQFLATRPDVVGVALARELEALQDKMAPFAQADAERTVAAALGKPLPDLFASFGAPVAAASIAQVHRAAVATDRGQRAVAVKVLRPGIEQRFKVDLDAFTFAARNAEKISAEARRLRLVEVVETLRRTVAIEMDLRFEAAALSEMAENTRNDPDFRVPAVDWDRTARDVLTLEWIEATPLSDRARLEAKGFDLKRLARAVIQTFLRQALRDGFFHADMHPGNLFVDDAGELVAVDFGIMGRLAPKERRFLAEILLGFITRNYHRTAEVHFEAGYVPRHHSVENFAQAIRAIGEPIHNRTAEEISMAKLFALLFEITGLFDMRTRPELLLLQKTMVVVEGVARSLDPKLDMWTVAEPVVREWIERNLGPVGRIEDAAEGALEVGRVLGDVPELLSRGAVLVGQLDAITRDGLVLAPETVADIGRAQARRNRWTAAALWAIALLLVLLIYLLVR